jgi:catechol 2,3-dioxygenase-like lactoylglutathione lyase family enzyme
VTDLDHVAVATTDIAATLGTLVGELGGVVYAGGDGYGFRWVQVRLGDPGARGGMTVEVLVVWQPDVNDFLDRFVARHGPGQHHLTFKVKDLEDTLRRVESAGFRPVGVDLRDPWWKEAFLQPREAHGTVVQLAEVHPDHPGTAEMVTAALADGPTGEPVWWPPPPPRAAAPATLRRVVMATPSLTAAVAFFAGLLQGDVVAETDEAVELAWPGGGRIRLEQDRTATPGFLRLEGDHEGTARVFDVSGARFSLSPR